MTVMSGGSQFVLAGGAATSSVVKAGGTQRVSSGGVARGGNVAGTQAIVAGGTATSMVIYGRQNVTGRASNSVIRKGGVQTVYAGGYAQATTVSSGGMLTVKGEGKTYKVGVLDGGVQELDAGAYANATTVSSGGRLMLASGASALALNVLSGGSASLAGGTQLSGSTSVSGALILTGAGNTVQTLKTTISTSVDYDITSVDVNGTTYMLSASAKQALSGEFSITTRADQQTGVYELSSGFTLASGTQFSLVLEGVGIGSVTLNGESLAYGSRNYVLTSDSAGRVQLTVSENRAASARSLLMQESAGYADSGESVASEDGMTLLFSGAESGEVAMTEDAASVFVAGNESAWQSIASQNILFGDDGSAFGCADALAASQHTGMLRDTWNRTGQLASI